MNSYKDFLAMVSTEFHRYLMENEGLGEKIPANAMVIFEVEGEDDFNRWHKETSLRNREPDQPVYFIIRRTFGSVKHSFQIVMSVMIQSVVTL